MAKVIVERPRRGHKDGPATTRMDRHMANQDVRCLNEDSPAFDNKVSMKRHVMRANLKELNENLNPLKRYLRSNVGRPWNKVYSDICKEISLNNAVQRHILEHLSHMVETNIIMKDGDPYVFVGSRYRKSNADDDGYAPLEAWSSHWRVFYVNPNNGLLCLAPQGKPRYRRQEPKNIYVRDPKNKLVSYWLLDDIWYEIRFRYPTAEEKKRQEFGYWGKHYNAAHNKWELYWFYAHQDIIHIPYSYRDTQFTRYERTVGAAIFPISKRQMNSREIKRAKKLLNAHQ
jgi:hypothetical protein